MTSEPIETQTDESFAVITAKGADAASFLNAQLTRRVDNLADDELALAAWCNAKGRVLALLRVSRASEGYELWLPASMLQPTLSRLRMFVLRSQVQLAETQPTKSPVAKRRLDDILAGIPQVYPETRELFLPQMLNLDTLGGIDFKKGCYPGQEIVARTHYLGQVKRRMFRYRLENAGRPAPGSVVVTNDEQSGTVVDAASDAAGHWQVLAVVPTESAGTDWHLSTPDGPSLTLEQPA